MTGNAGAHHGSIRKTTLDADMAAYDRLPTAVRASLRDSAVNISAVSMLEHLERGFPERDLLEAIKTAQRNASAVLARDLAHGL